MSYTINGNVTSASDWADSKWNIDVLDASYIKQGTVIEIDSGLNVSFTQGSRTITTPANLAEGNGLLWFEFETTYQTVTTTGAEVPAGTPIQIVLSMIVLKDADGNVDRHVTALTLVDDPQDAGVMGAEEAGPD